MNQLLVAPLLGGYDPASKKQALILTLLKLIQLEEQHVQQLLGRVSQQQTSSMQQIGPTKAPSNDSTTEKTGQNNVWVNCPVIC